MISISTNYDENDFLFYDIEVFKNDALVVFMDNDENIVAEYHLCPDNRVSKPFSHINDLIKGKVLVGYNNYHYDDIILTLMMGNDPDNLTLKRANDAIINDVSYFLPRVSDDILSLDAWQQISVAKSGLKKVEANMGLSIEETPIDFNMDRQLTPDELEQVFKYCRHDVSCTVKIFKMRWHSYFVPKLGVVAMLPDGKQSLALRWNTTSITQHVLTGGDNITIPVPDDGYIDYSKYDFLPVAVADMWSDPDKKTKKVIIDECGIEFEFGFGGLHGVPRNNVKEYNRVKLLDVASMYPNLLIQFKGLEECTEKYQDIVNQRLKIKHEDPIRSNALKLIINSTYGLLRPEYSKFFNPVVADAVCFKGQIVLYDLCLRLYQAGYRIINVNTDGVAFTGEGFIDFHEIWHDWEEDYGLTLELSEFDKWIQRDVNCYIAVKDDKIKVKGGDVKKYHDTTDFDGVTDPVGDSWCNTNTCGIVAKAVVDYLVYGKDIYDTLFDYLDKPILYQFIMQAGRTYDGNIDTDGNTDYQRLNRGFAVKAKFTDIPIYKYKTEVVNDEKIIRKTKYPNTPSFMHIYNGDLNDMNLHEFKKMIDIDYYNSLCERALDLFNMGKDGKAMTESLELIEKEQDNEGGI